MWPYVFFINMFWWICWLYEERFCLRLFCFPINGIQSTFLNRIIALLLVHSLISLLTSLINLIICFHRPHISPVCLPPPQSEFTGQTCTITGWGKDGWGSQGEFQAILKETKVPILNHEVCQQVLRTTKLGTTYNLHQGMMCAGGEANKDACKVRSEYLYEQLETFRYICSGYLYKLLEWFRYVQLFSHGKQFFYR